MQGTYAVIGDPIDHSLSPAAHNAAFRELGMDSSYIAYRIRRGDLRDGLESLAAARIVGFNVTIPHKVDIMEYLDSTDAECEDVGACNTVSIDGGRLKGHNTDVRGFVDPFTRRDIRVRGRTALVLGSGGAARAVVLGLARSGVSSIVVAARSPARAQDLVALAGRSGVAASHVGMDGAAGAAADSGVIVNATPIGMGGEESPVPAASIGADSVVYDIVYRPMKTALIECALARGATVVYGHEMLVGQAMGSFEIWHGVPAPYGPMRGAILGVGHA